MQKIYHTYILFLSISLAILEWWEMMLKGFEVYRGDFAFSTFTIKRVSSLRPVDVNADKRRFV